MVQEVRFTGVNAADDLVGKTLPGDWKVVSRIEQSPGDTGGNFSINYFVEGPNSQEGFCKVLNVHWLSHLQTSDPISALRRATEVYEFERDVAWACVKLSKVITVIDHNSFLLSGYQTPLVSFIIFEVAECDVRRFMNTSEEMDAVTKLRVLHQLVTGVRQLHGIGIAHQDIKPSNTLIFPEVAGFRETKAGDLGRATMKGRPTMHHDLLTIAGDPSYAPPEGLYGAIPDSFGARRLACDLYQLGGMITFLFTGFTFNAYLALEIHPSHHWNNWTGTFDDAMPYIRDAYGRALEHLRNSAPPELASDVVLNVAQLCEPDPLKRGHRKGFTEAATGNYSLTRFVTAMDLLARRAELLARGTA